MAILVIESMGGEVHYKGDPEGMERLLARLIGWDYFVNISDVRFRQGKQNEVDGYWLSEASSGPPPLQYDPAITLDDDGLKVIEDLGALEQVIIENVNITDNGMIYLASLDGLTSLTLVNTGVTDTGLSHLVALSELRHLDLGETRITDAGLDQLHDLRKLEFLSVKGTAVTAEGVARLKLRLPTCQVLGCEQ